MFKDTQHLVSMAVVAAVLLTGAPVALGAGERPDAPTGIISGVTGGSVMLSWQEPADDDRIEGYNVYRDNQYLTTVSDTRYEGDIAEGAVHSFYVVAFDTEPRRYSTASETVYLPQAPAIEDNNTAPGAPGGLTGTISGSDVALQWQASTDDVAVLGYNVYENNRYITTVTATNYTGRVEAGRNYTYYIVAFDGRQNFSPRSQSLSLPDGGSVPVSDTTAPSQPRALTGNVVAGGSGDTFRVSWQASSDNVQVLGYNVYVNDNYTTTVTGTTFETVLGADSSNRFQIVAFDAVPNFSQPSESLTLHRGSSATDPADGPDTTPVDSDVVLSAATGLTGTMDQNGNVRITWSAPSVGNPTGYNVYRNNAYVASVSTSSYSATLNPDEVYSFYVTAYDGRGNFSARSARLTLPDSDNLAPFFVNLEDQVIEAGPVWEYRIQPADIDGDLPGLFIGTLPTGMQELDNRDGSRTLRWRPLQPDVGNYSIEITAYDADDPDLTTVVSLGLQVVLPADLSIIPNLAPTIDAVGDHVVRAGDPIVLRVKAVDANGTVPDLVILNPPEGSTFTALATDPRVRELRYQSGADDIGVTVFDFFATDAEDASLTATATASLEFRPGSAFERDGSRLRNLARQAGIDIGYASLLEVTAKPDGVLYQDIAREEFNLVTPENSMKWGYVNPERGVYRWEEADTLVAFAAQHGMQVHGHALVWYAQLPQWVQQSDVAERESLMNAFIDTMIARYPNVDIWDVVNEAFEDDGRFRNSVWFEAMGESHIDRAFRRARLNDADATLIYNDYDVAAGGPKTDAMYALVARLVRDGVPIDGVGFQMHVTTDYQDFAAVAATFQRFADLGLDIYITELDVNRVDGDSDADQAAVFANTVRTCMQQPACRAVQTWGFTDRYTWRSPNTPLLLDEEYQAKESYRAVQRALTGQ